MKDSGQPCTSPRNARGRRAAARARGGKGDQRAPILLASEQHNLPPAYLNQSTHVSWHGLQPWMSNHTAAGGTSRLRRRQLASGGSRKVLQPIMPAAAWRRPKRFKRVLRARGARGRAASGAAEGMGDLGAAARVVGGAPRAPEAGNEVLNDRATALARRLS